MKKLFALFLALALSLGAVGAMAQPAETAPEAPEEFLKPPAFDIQLKDEEVRSVFPETEDKLTIAEDGTYILVTNDFTIQIQLPFGVLAFTQDMGSQLADYLQLNDGRAVAEHLIAHEINVLFLDSTGMEVWMYLSTTRLSQMFVNSQENYPTLLATAQQIAGDSQQISEIKFGDTFYLKVLEEGNGRQYLMYYNIIDGVRIVYQIQGQEITPEMEEFLGSVVESVTVTGAQ